MCLKCRMAVDCRGSYNGGGGGAGGESLSDNIFRIDSGKLFQASHRITKSFSFCTHAIF